MKDKKQYRLKMWYPSLKKTVEVGCIITKIYTCGGYHYRGSDNEGVIFYVSGSQCENNPDFWELIEEEKPKPLFITDDGVEVFDRDEYFTIGYDFNKRNMIAYNCDAPYSTGVIRFKHESNADEYIWRNKRVFSYEDMMKAKHSIILTYEDIEKAAKERIEE